MMRCLLQSWTVPVVYGGGDYSQYLPPHSYIAAGDFQTARELAAHLVWLMENPEQYLKYFWWKSHYQIVEEISPDRPHSLPASFSCQLCQYLNTQTEQKQVSNLQEQWADSAQCQARFTYHCNRDIRNWFPLRKGYKPRQLSIEKRIFIVFIKYFKMTCFNLINQKLL